MAQNSEYYCLIEPCYSLIKADTLADAFHLYQTYIADQDSTETVHVKFQQISGKIAERIYIKICTSLGIAHKKIVASFNNMDNEILLSDINYQNLSIWNELDLNNEVVEQTYLDLFQESWEREF